ncbi:MAG: thioredoxin family protein [Actinomycetota bacterium]|nr:thioredoxin family protein [Actinomycetota bacterium]
MGNAPSGLPTGDLSARPEAPAGPRLQVYVTAACGTCIRTQELVAQLRRSRPGAAVEVVDLDQLPPGHPLPAGLVGTPTYYLDGRVRWLGNPDPADLLAVWDDSDDPAQPPALSRPALTHRRRSKPAP